MGYIEDHPTHFNWHPAVRRRVKAVQNAFPWLTYINSYWDHPPDTQVPRRWPPGFYDAKSLDVWDGGLDEHGNYTGYRGKTLPAKLGWEIFNMLFYAEDGPEIDWIIYRDKMWWNPKTGGPGWTGAPSGPRGSDARHLKHIHVTYLV